MEHVKKKRRMHPNSLANLKKGRRFSSEDGYAKEAKLHADAARRLNYEMEKEAQQHLDEIAAELFAEQGLREFAKLSTEGKNQAVRIAARQLADQKTAWPALQWLFEQYLGRAKQRVEQQVEGGLTVSKPGVVFRSGAKDIEE